MGELVIGLKIRIIKTPIILTYEYKKVDDLDQKFLDKIYSDIINLLKPYSCDKKTLIKQKNALKNKILDINPLFNINYNQLLKDWDTVMA